ncbi:type VII toxin-antitoxin system HepT family RNase toxin [Pseudoalteromonas sp.]|uniref:type VII toxin-antitoxin system HepT family RNase toxin n=1 Tax=Pseudoalteromonas sp. TaxID=53249 RepID=UPI0030011981
MSITNMQDVIINKLSTIKRCLGRINDEFTNELEFKQSYTKQDSVILNLQRACEACIDIANILIKYHKLGIPQSARNSFELIANAGLISTDSATALKKMVGLRNIAVHDYQTLNLDIIIAVINKHLSDFEKYSKEVAQQTLT